MSVASILSFARKLLAIEVLEYEDKNLLYGDENLRSKQKQEMLREMIIDIEKLR